MKSGAVVARGMAWVEELRKTPYDFVRPLAEGGMGEVSVVRHRELGDECVMKVVRADLAQHAGPLTERLRAEARMVRSLIHENLARVLDFGFTESGRAYLVTELLTGRSLKDELKLREVLPLDEVLEVGAQILAGLEVVHAASIVHRDIKPDNLFYCAPNAQGRRVVKLLDFGIAKILDPVVREAAGISAATATGVSVGTPLYFAPEQALAKPVDARTDLYGVGAVLLHLATGLPPFMVRRPSDLFEAHAFAIPDAPSTRNADLPKSFDALVLQALQKQPERRFVHAASMRASLAEVAAEWSARGAKAVQNHDASPSRPTPGLAELLGVRDRTPQAGVAARVTSARPPSAPEVRPGRVMAPTLGDLPGPAGQPIAPSPKRARDPDDERYSLWLGLAVSVVALLVIVLLLLSFG